MSASGPREATVLTHRRTDETTPALERLMAAARAAGVTLRFDPEETRKHELRERPGIVLDAPIIDSVYVCLVLGGDGTILRALQRYAHTGVPVFAVNYGEIGFLATVERDELDGGLRRAFSGDYELLGLPAIALDTPDGVKTAINDVAIHRKAGRGWPSSPTHSTTRSWGACAATFAFLVQFKVLKTARLPRPTGIESVMVDVLLRMR